MKRGCYASSGVLSLLTLMQILKSPALCGANYLNFAFKTGINLCW